ncbi:hypothetical protein GCM10027570_50970 [Streptomonospora sediminis]
MDYPRFMVEAVENDALVHETPAIVGRLTPSALAHTGTPRKRRRRRGRPAQYAARAPARQRGLGPLPCACAAAP